MEDFHDRGRVPCLRSHDGRVVNSSAQSIVAISGRGPLGRVAEGGIIPYLVIEEILREVESQCKYWEQKPPNIRGCVAKRDQTTSGR